MGNVKAQEIVHLITDFTIKGNGGITPRKITKIIKPKMDERTVRRYLSHLRKEGIVIKGKKTGHKNEYFATRAYLQTQSFFVYQMRRIVRKMIYSIRLKPDVVFESLNHKLYYPSSVYGLTKPEHEFYESMCRDDSTISIKHCRTKFGQTEIDEKRIFEFVNRIGAFITYVFIESLNALGKDKESNSGLESRINNAIDLQSFFKEFCYLFGIITTTNVGSKVEDIQEISKAFKNMYPAAKALERYWLGMVKLSEEFAVSNAK